MNLHLGIRRTCFVAIYLGIALSPFAFAADTASELSAKLRAKESGSMFIRIRMQIGSGEKQTLQIQNQVSCFRHVATSFIKYFFRKSGKVNRFCFTDPDTNSVGHCSRCRTILNRLGRLT